MEFINAPIGQHSNLAIEAHSQAYYTSRLLDFTSKKLNEILESENLSLQIIYVKITSENLNEILESEDLQAENLNDYMIKDLKSLDIKTDEN
ncbi:hypothetical protein RhiirA5_367644 [Rhizophagus irregularis]|uniref:Uncharacterized protein n=1 Tax=Rhizophagus irregularis TaxID=588596 RepID=A0A2N0NQJ5_9GLOM|nr:hypothetical protein RhiirA5_367644 [Rhizophagus irregularis]